jgi:hypothetical protein
VESDNTRFLAIETLFSEFKIYLSETFAPSNFTRKGFVYSKEELLIPNPKTDNEKYELAKGLRAAQTKNN